MIRRLTSAPKPWPRVAQVVGEDVALAEPRAVADAVVAGEVGRRLGRRDDVVGREAVVRVRQADVLDRRARPPRARRPPRGRAPRPPAPCRPRSTRAAGRGACHGARPRPRRRRPAARSSVGRHRLGRRGRVAVVATGDGVQQRRRVPDVARERPDLVERAGEGDDPVAADPAVGRLEPDDAAQRRRLADRAAGVGADRQRGVEGGDGRRGPAAAATRARGPAPTGWPSGRRPSARWTSPSRTRPCWSCRG